MRSLHASWRQAVTTTIPVMVGYIFTGIAFGILFAEHGYGALWAALMSAAVYAGSMQFVAINFFSGGVSLLAVAAITLVVNIRHIFYGLSMLEPFAKMGKSKWYMIFALTDETYSLLCSASTPAGQKPERFFLQIAVLNQLYWILGSVAGALIAKHLPFDTAGIDFAMTAMFIVIALEQWLASRNHIPAAVGFLAAVSCLIIFGKEGFILPTMLLVTLALCALKRPCDRRLAADLRAAEAEQAAAVSRGTGGASHD